MKLTTVNTLMSVWCGRVVWKINPSGLSLQSYDPVAWSALNECPNSAPQTPLSVDRFKPTTQQALPVFPHLFAKDPQMPIGKKKVLGAAGSSFPLTSGLLVQPSK